LSFSARPKTILLVEDERGVREFISTVLSSQGYQILEADDGPTAEHIHEAHSGDIHLVLVDLTLPAGSGLDVAQKIAAARPTAKIVLMSGFSDETHHTHDFLAKPFSLQDLIGKVKFHLPE
jgi:DNA-binding response OmpR family regulator